MSLDMVEQGIAFFNVPEELYRLRWEIWQNGARVKYQSWTPNAELKFSEQRLRFENADLIIACMSLEIGIEQAMLKVKIQDVEKLEYLHLITAKKGNLCAGIKIHTFMQGIWNCCVNGDVFEEVAT